MATISRLDERNISSVLIRYATSIDGRDWPLLRSCFTTDFEGRYESPNFGEFKVWPSGDAIVGAMAKTHESFGATLHRISNITISASHGSITARSYVDAILMPREPTGPLRCAAGTYDDRLVKQSGVWRICRRDFTLVHLIS